MTGQGPHGAALVIIAVIMATVALSVASAVFAPVAFALFIIALVWPLQKRLQAAMPRLLALLVCVIVMGFVFVVFGWLITWAFGRVARWTVSEAGRFQMIYEQGVAFLESHGIAVSGLWPHRSCTRSISRPAAPRDDPSSRLAQANGRSASCGCC